MFAAGPPSAQQATTCTWRGLWGWSLLRYTHRTDRTSASPRTRPQKYASPVQFVTGLRTLFDAGARVFVECGPKRALAGFASDVLGDDEALVLHTNHPKTTLARAAFSLPRAES